MARLRQSDLLGVLRLAHELNDAEDFNAFTAQAALGLQRLIPSESATCVEVDSRRRRVTGFVDPIDAVPNDAENQVYWAYRHQNPVARHRGRADDASALKISDFATRRKFHRLDLYDGFFRPLGVEHQISVGLARASRRSVVAGCNRAGRDFSERDRLVFNLLHPHLVQAHRNVAVRARAALLLAGLERAVEGGRQGYLLLGPNGEVEAASAGVLQLLERYIGARALPSWIERRRGAPNPFELGRDGNRVRITISAARDAAETLLLLEQLPSKTPAAPSLQPRGLTPREAEVMTWVARGKTNREIGSALFVSQRTVQKHLEHIFEKLGVRTRTEAVAVAFGHVAGEPSATLSQAGDTSVVTGLARAPA